METIELSTIRRVNTTAAMTPTPDEEGLLPVLRHGTHLSRILRLENKLDAARARLNKYQKQWGEIGKELPPQINRRHISVISVGGVIGTGVYIGISTALYHAGPAGTLLGFAITGSVVWSVVISIGELVAFVPNVGGPVGLAGLYVDPALGFALGWNAWYNWTIILPTELSAAAILFQGFFEGSDKVGPEIMQRINMATISTFLVLAILINCFGARAYGEAEFFLSCLKIITIVSLIIAGLALDLGAGNQGRLGFRYWAHPGAFKPYRHYANPNWGKFLGVWSSMNQAVFAFFGTEVPGVAAGEVQNPEKNIPRAINRVWIRITLFYILAVFVAGLLVCSNDGRLVGSSGFLPGNLRTGNTTQFCDTAAQFCGGMEQVLINEQQVCPDLAAVQQNKAPPMLFTNSQWKCYSCPNLEDICTESNARCINHTAPGNAGPPPAKSVVFRSPFVIAFAESGANHLDKVCTAAFVLSAFSAAVSDVYISSRFLYYLARCGHAPRFCAAIYKSERTKTVVPWVGVLVSSGFAMLAFMSFSRASEVFHWLSSMNSTTALLSWIGMIFTYLRWYQGTLAAEKRDPRFREKHKDDIYKNRYRLQPWIAIYAFVMCVLVLFFNGWFVFTRPGPWRMALKPGESLPEPDPDFGNWVPSFVSSYLALPVFLLLVLGYKLVYRTKTVALNEMPFERGNIPEIEEHVPTTRFGRLLAVLF